VVAASGWLIQLKFSGSLQGFAKMALKTDHNCVLLKPYLQDNFTNLIQHYI